MEGLRFASLLGLALIATSRLTIPPAPRPTTTRAGWQIHYLADRSSDLKTVIERAADSTIILQGPDTFDLTQRGSLRRFMIHNVCGRLPLTIHREKAVV